MNKENTCSYGEIKTTQEYFNMTIDELLETKDYGTKEECKILDDGIRIVYYDSIKELERDKDNLLEFMRKSPNPYYWIEIKSVLLTINKRLAVVLV